MDLQYSIVLYTYIHMNAPRFLDQSDARTAGRPTAPCSARHVARAAGMVYSHRGPVSRSFKEETALLQRGDGSAQPWQDRVLKAVMDAEPQALARALDAMLPTCERALSGRVMHKTVGGSSLFFVFEERLYSADAEGVREALGGAFNFEHEEERSTAALWRLHHTI